MKEDNVLKGIISILLGLCLPKVQAFADETANNQTSSAPRMEALDFILNPKPLYYENNNCHRL